MLFSVIIPVYNVEQYLKRCLDSIVSQDCNDFEIVLVDDGSTDLSGKICDKYKNSNSQIIKVIHKKNEGLLLARRDGISHASGDYLLFVDSDDFLPAHALSRYKKCIDQLNPDFILTDLYCEYMNGETARTTFFNKLSDKPAPGELSNNINMLKMALLTQKYCCWSMCQKCVKRDIVKTDFDFRKYKGLQYGEDTLQTLFILNNSKNFVYLDGCLYKYRIGTGMTANTSVKRCKDFYDVASVIKQYCRSWTKRIDDFADIYLEMNVVGYIYELSMTNISRAELLKRIKTVVNYKKTFRSLKRGDELRNDVINELNKSRKICNHLIANKRFHSLYVYLMIHKVLRSHNYKNRNLS